MYILKEIEYLIKYPGSHFLCLMIQVIFITVKHKINFHLC